MNRSPTHASNNSGLSRAGNGLSAAHVALIKMLAEIAVEDFLRESEAGKSADDLDEVTR